MVQEPLTFEKQRRRASVMVMVGVEGWGAVMGWKWRFSGEGEVGRGGWWEKVLESRVSDGYIARYDKRSGGISVEGWRSGVRRVLTGLM